MPSHGRRQELPRERYEVGAVLASGGMGTIHQAYDSLARREIAYKRLRISLEAERPRLSALFQREYDTLARLHHPNIVEVYDYGFDQLGPYYTMELLSGSDLSRLAPLSVREGCRVLRDVASALALLHARRKLHRDVSPNNVRLTQQRAAKLLDFGALTDFGVPMEVVGTPAFIAPECLTRTPLDQRTDLYALGALAYWTLTRKVPFRAHRLEELPDAWKVELSPPSRHNPAIPPELDELVLSLLQIERIARPSAAADVIERLTSIAELEPEQDERAVAYSYLKHPPIVGRQEAMQALGRGLEGALSGRGQLLLVEGAPGLGRTAMLDQLALMAQLRGATVLRAAGTVHGQPLGVVSHLVELGFATYPDLAHEFEDNPLLTIRSNSDANVPKVRSSAEAAEQLARRSSLLQEVLLYLSLRNPLVLEVDDAQQVDDQSLALLASMASLVQGHPLLVVVGGPAGEAKSTAHVRLRSGSERTSLPPLSEAQVNELVETMFGGVPNSHPLALWLHAQSGGNPAQCMDLVRMLLQRGAVRYAIGTFTLPHELELVESGLKPTTLLLARLEGLSDESLRIVHLMSLQESALTVEQMALASALPAPEVVSALGQLIERNVMVSSSGRYAYASQGLRRAVALQLDPSTTRTLHVALARMLLADGQRQSNDAYLAGLHLIQTGGAEELEGARLIADVTLANLHEAAVSAAALAPMEAALDVLGRHGSADTDVVHLLVPLSVAGFYGNVRAQARYLERAMSALFKLSGLNSALRLKRVLGTRAALIVGLVCGAIRGLWKRPRYPTLTFRQQIEAVMGVASAGCAAAASMLDALEAARVVRWLDPFAAVPEGSALQISREFCVATADTVAGKLQPASLRYARLLATLRKPVRGMSEQLRERLMQGCLHGIAQTSVEFDAKRALAAADELAESSAFFAAHVETIRMAHHGYHGRLDQVALHRGRAEMLALRGGASWSALTMLSLRTYYASALTGDVTGLARNVADAGRLAALSPGAQIYYQLMQAHLLCLRGRPEEALPIYERTLTAEPAQHIASYGVECGLYARALSLTGQHARAKALCEATLADVERTGRRTPHTSNLLVQQLALAEAGLGNFTRAAELVERHFAEADPDNALELGSLHHVRAEVALLAGDEPAFAQHFAAMNEQLRATTSPWLIQLCQAFVGRAVAAGMLVAPSDAADAFGHEELDAETAVGSVRPPAEGSDPRRAS